jgi:CheY-like chemotaxis protein
LPLAVAHDDSRVHPRAAVASVDVAGTKISLSGIKVMVVDDELDAREMVKRLLTRCGADVVTAASVNDALSKIEEAKPGVLISDVGMPGQDGYELIRQVRMLGGSVGNVKAIALTAFGRLEDRTRSMLAGYQMHLAKPIEPSELIITVATLSGVVGYKIEN